MRTSIVACAFLLVLGTIAGCANGSGTPTDGGLDVRIMIPDTGGTVLPDVPPVTTDTPLVMPDTPPPRPDTGTGPVCSTIPCTTVADCAACAPRPGGSNCCDTSVGRCFSTTAPMCPAGPTDGGMSMY
jgi:hypothetical protein